MDTNFNPTTTDYSYSPSTCHDVTLPKTSTTPASRPLCHPSPTVSTLSSYRFSPYSLARPVSTYNTVKLPQFSDLLPTVHSSGTTRTCGCLTCGANSSSGTHGSTSSLSPLGTVSSGSNYATTATTSHVSATSSPATADKGHSGISVVLTEKELWRLFNLAGNEMIVTKPGRCIFPTLLINVTGLIHKVSYTISVRFVSADNDRHKFIFGQWRAVGQSDIIQDESQMIFTHPLSPCNGEIWMKKPISFKTIKITHHEHSKSGNILLHTMHKYRIEVVITARNDVHNEMVFPLEDTDFIAVTSYQSSSITKLKIQNNPYAKSFTERQKFRPSFGFQSPCALQFNSFLEAGGSTAYSSSGHFLPYYLHQECLHVPAISNSDTSTNNVTTVSGPMVTDDVNITTSTTIGSNIQSDPTNVPPLTYSSFENIQPMFKPYLTTTSPSGSFSSNVVYPTTYLQYPLPSMFYHNMTSAPCMYPYTGSCTSSLPDSHPTATTGIHPLSPISNSASPSLSICSNQTNSSSTLSAVEEELYTE